MHLIFKLPVNPLSNSASRSLLGDSFPLTSALKFLHALTCKGVRTALPLSCLEVLAMLRVNYTTGECTAILKEDEPSSPHGSWTCWGCMHDHSWPIHQAACQSHRNSLKLQILRKIKTVGVSFECHRRCYTIDMSVGTLLA